MNKINFEASLDLFLDLAIERHSIYIKKENGDKKPWTDNQIFREFFFCNVFRQYDKCSKWIIENISPFQRWDLIILYRFISTMDTFLDIQKNCPLDELKKIHNFLHTQRVRGDKIFSSCFIRNCKVPGGWIHAYQVPFLLIKDIKANGQIEQVMNKNSLQSLVYYFKQFSATGGFMGYEYSCDLEYTNLFFPTDKLTWANPGPGAKRGLSLLLYGTSHVRIKEEVWFKFIPIVFSAMKEKFEEIFPKETITMREVEHWLCEFSKYIKYHDASINNYRVKYRKYNGV